MTARRLLLALLILLTAGPATGQAVVVASQQGARLTRIEGEAVAGAFTVLASPAVVAADGHGRLYVSHPDGHAVSVIEPDGAVRRLSLRAQAFGLAVEPDGSRLYVGDWSGNRVLCLSPATGVVEAEIPVGPDPAGLVLGGPGRLYVAEREGRSVGVIDTGAMRRVSGLPVGDGPFALAYDPALARLYVANVRSNDVTVFDTAVGRVLATIPAGTAPYGVAVVPGSGRVLVTNQHAATVSVIDAVALTVAATIPVGRYPEGVAILGGFAYVANWFSDDVSVIDLAALKETRRLPVAEGPRTLAVARIASPEAAR
jgi:YVTN family beta-propeller protein